MVSTIILAATQVRVAYGTAQALIIFGAGLSATVLCNYVMPMYKPSHANVGPKSIPASIKSPDPLMKMAEGPHRNWIVEATSSGSIGR